MDYGLLPQGLGILILVMLGKGPRIERVPHGGQPDFQGPIAAIGHQAHGPLNAGVFRPGQAKTLFFVRTQQAVFVP